MASKVRMMTVLLVDDVNTEQAQMLADAMKLMVNVEDVSLEPIDSLNDVIARSEAKRTLGTVLMAIIHAMTAGFPNDKDKSLVSSVIDAVAVWKEKSKYGSSS